jgi:acyl-CoA thioesterase FadM
LGIVLTGPDDETRAEFDLTLVCVERDAVASRGWPEDVRSAIEAWMRAG